MGRLDSSWPRRTDRHRARRPCRQRPLLSHSAQFFCISRMSGGSLLAIESRSMPRSAILRYRRRAESGPLRASARSSLLVRDRSSVIRTTSLAPHVSSAARLARLSRQARQHVDQVVIAYGQREEHGSLPAFRGLAHLEATRVAAPCVGSTEAGAARLIGRNCMSRARLARQLNSSRKGMAG